MQQWRFCHLEDMFGAIEVLVFPKTLDENSQLLQEGEIIQLLGRVSAREEEDAKIICDQVASLPASVEESLLSASKNRNAGATKAEKNGLYLRVPARECSEMDRAKRLLAVFEGITPVFVYFESERKLMKAPKNMWIDVNDVLLRELRRVLGEQNVVLRTEAKKTGENC